MPEHVLKAVLQGRRLPKEPRSRASHSNPICPDGQGRVDEDSVRLGSPFPNDIPASPQDPTIPPSPIRFNGESRAGTPSVVSASGHFVRSLETSCGLVIRDDSVVKPSDSEDEELIKVVQSGATTVKKTNLGRKRGLSNTPFASMGNLQGGGSRADAWPRHLRSKHDMAEEVDETENGVHEAVQACFKVVKPSSGSDQRFSELGPSHPFTPTAMEQQVVAALKSSVLESQPTLTTVPGDERYLQDGIVEDNVDSLSSDDQYVPQTPSPRSYAQLTRGATSPRLDRRSYAQAARCAITPRFLDTGSEQGQHPPERYQKVEEKKVPEEEEWDESLLLTSDQRRRRQKEL